ncbi:MAG: hypothetical protein AAF340_02365 [Pseudomonadota bacterium]
MTLFRNILIGMTVLIIFLTIMAVVDGGLNLITPFVGPILDMTWQGQFNFDFTCYLILSGIWMAWRGGFTGGSVALGLLAPPLGIFFFAPFLIFLIGQSNGDPKRLLLGVHAET